MLKKILTTVALTVALSSIAQAETNIFVNKSTQRMTVSPQNYEFKVSTAMPGHITPSGTFHPISLEKMHRSRKYHNSPMPYSIFYSGGYAIHGTNAIGHLGRPASHGCVRLSPHDAKIVFDLVRNDSKTTIKIIDR